MKNLFEIDGYHVVLAQVQNVYGIEQAKTGWCWGFKYISGIFEFFYYKTKIEAKKDHDKFITALNDYYEN